MMYTTWQQGDPDRLRRTGRSKNGCLTCKRRKVRCNQQRPRCGHCCRLQLDCTWRRALSPSLSGQHDHQINDSQIPSPVSAVAPEQDPPRAQDSLVVQPSTIPTSSHHDIRFEEMFDYASFLWDPDVSPIWSPELWYDTETPSKANTLSPSMPLPIAPISQPLSDLSPQLSTDRGRAPDPNQLIEYFKHSDAPPILAPIETRFRWTAMRKLFTSMASASQMVHYAILSFSVLQLQRRHNQFDADYADYYNKSQAEMSKSLVEEEGSIRVIGTEIQSVLATLFLLSYVDLVTDRTNWAQRNLRKAYGVVCGLDLRKLDVTEKRLVSWIRLLDARAVSAGGEGLFLREESENELNPDLSSSSGLSSEAEDAEDVLSDILSRPSTRFFQRIQSFVGRITRIDKWHRTRGTVEDETEVMAIARQIQKDNHALYRHRPRLMDLAVAGKLHAPLIAPNLAVTITRSLRTYLANYHATFIHLHRVAYRHLPRTADVCNAMKVISQMTRLMVDAQRDDESLPVNMLWPLLMWGAEEENADERAWILSMIRKMSNAVTNAQITADVLLEVIRRQDESGQRSDIREVMQETFNSCFAVV